MNTHQLAANVVERFAGASVPTIGDVLVDEYGLRYTMSYEIRQVVGKRRIVGRAVTALWVPRQDPTGGYGAEQFFAAVDSCHAGSILVLSNGGDKSVSCMGDLVATALQARGSEGAVMDGAVRDIAPMIEMDFPIFAASVSPATPAGRSAVVGHNIPIVCGGVPVRPGDVIIADWDGVVVVPQEHAVEVLEKSLALEESERDLRDHIRANAGKQKLGDLFAGH